MSTVMSLKLSQLLIPNTLFWITSLISCRMYRWVYTAYGTHTHSVHFLSFELFILWKFFQTNKALALLYSVLYRSTLCVYVCVCTYVQHSTWTTQWYLIPNLCPQRINHQRYFHCGPDCLNGAVKRIVPNSGFTSRKVVRWEDYIGGWWRGGKGWGMFSLRLVSYSSIYI